MGDQAVGCDIISVRQHPLHAVPVLQHRERDGVTYSLFLLFTRLFHCLHC